MARDTDLCGRSKQLARLPWINIPLAQMDAICPKPFGQVHAIIDDKRYIAVRSDAHTSELQSLMRNQYAVFRLQKNKSNAIYCMHKNKRTTSKHNTQYTSHV